MHEPGSSGHHDPSDAWQRLELGHLDQLGGGDMIPVGGIDGIHLRYCGWRHDQRQFSIPVSGESSLLNGVSLLQQK